MAQEYLERLNLLIGRLISGSLKNVKLECKHFFSGAAVYAHGRICMSWTPVGFAMKLPEPSRATLISERGAKYLRHFPKGPIKKDYVVLPESILEETKTLGRLARMSVEYALSLPVSETKKKHRITRRSTGRAKAARR